MEARLRLRANGSLRSFRIAWAGKVFRCQKIWLVSFLCWPEPGILRSAPAREISRLPFQTRESPCRLLGVCAGIKRRDSKIAFAFGAEPRAGSDDHLDLFQDFIEHLLAVAAGWSFHP